MKSRLSRLGASLLIAGSLAVAGGTAAMADPAPPSFSSSAVQNANDTVTLTATSPNYPANSACFVQFVTAQGAGSGYVSCFSHSAGFRVQLTTANAYAASTIQWEVTDASANPTYGPFTADVARPTAAPRKFSATYAPKISGTVKTGHTIKVSLRTWKPAATHYAYQWYLNGRAIAKATKSKLTLSKKWKGKKVSVKVTGSRKGYYTVSRFSATKRIA